MPCPEQEYPCASSCIISSFLDTAVFSSPANLKFCDTARDMKGYNTGEMAETIFTGICKAFEIQDSKSNIEAVYHTVVKGDTLWIISRRYKTTVDNIVALNEIENINSIVVGKKIQIK